jgi:UDP-N-acetylmuramate dehydrogenase
VLFRSKLENFSKEIKGKLVFNYDLKKTNWFNIGGKTKVYFRPESLSILASFLKNFGKKIKKFKKIIL